MKAILSLVAAVGFTFSSCTPVVHQRPATGQRVEKQSTPETGDLESVLSSITTLRYQDLERTPLTPKTITVHYAFEDHPHVNQPLLERALPYVRTFWQEYGIRITFNQVSSLDDVHLDQRTTFGLNYLSEDWLVAGHAQALVAYAFANSPGAVCAQGLAPGPSRVCVREVSTGAIERIKLLVRDHFRSFLGEYGGGLGYRCKGVVVLVGAPHWHESLETIRQKVAAFENSNQFPVDVDARLFAGAITHELGHIWGLRHTYECVDDLVRDYHDGGPNLMSRERPIKSLSQTAFWSSYTPEHVLGFRLHPLQQRIAHNFLAGGIVFQTMAEGCAPQWQSDIFFADSLHYNNQVQVQNNLRQCNLR